ncbi:unnamed protein product [Alopecurus aequalis]
MGRRKAAASAIAGSDPPGGRHLSIPKPPTPGVESLTARKRPRSRENKNPTLAGSIRPDDPSLAKYGGEILVLFETPSGFAIFCLKEHCLNQPNAMEYIWAIFGKDYRSREIVWLKEFRTFKDKSSAINRGTGVSKELSEMISRHHCPGQKLAVGKREYKRIIETSLADVPCLVDKTVKEVMWGLKNLMHSLVPQEEVKLTKEDRLPMCRGIKKFLHRYGFVVKPEMINEKFVETSCMLFDADLVEKKHSKSVHWAADKLKVVSGINSESWDTMKIAKALKIMFEPLEMTVADIQMFTKEELITFVEDSNKYDDLIRQDVILKINNELVEARAVKTEALEALGNLL